MSRILHHVGRNDFKKTRQRQIGEKKECAAKELKERQEAEAERKIIEEAAKPFKSDWRLDFLIEAMTTAGLGMVNYPAEGDVDLEIATHVNSSVTPGTPGSGGSGAHADFGSYDETGNAGFVLYLDTTKYDTIKFNANRGGATKIELSFEYSGTFQTLSSGTNIITIPSVSRGKRVAIAFNANKSGGTGATGATISGVTFRRRTPINVMVPLDDPEANSFIRGGLGGSEERRQKLKEMLESSNEWMYMLGLEPSKTSPGDIELASHDKPFSKYPPAGGDDKWPGLPQDAIKNYLHPSKDPLLNTPITPFGLPKDFKAQSGDIELAASYPKMDPLDKLLKDIDDVDRKFKNKRPGTRPGKGRGMGDTWEGPGKIV